MPNRKQNLIFIFSKIHSSDRTWLFTVQFVKKPAVFISRLECAVNCGKGKIPALPWLLIRGANLLDVFTKDYSLVSDS